MIIVCPRLNLLRTCSEHALGTEHEKHSGYVRKIIYGLTGDSNSLEDLVNDTFIKLTINISALRALDCRKRMAYLVYTTRSVAIDALIRRGVQNKHIYYGADADLSENVADLSASVEERLMHQDGVDEIFRVIAEPPQRQKDILYLRYVLRMEHEDIARLLNLAP